MVSNPHKILTNITVVTYHYKQKQKAKLATGEWSINNKLRTYKCIINIIITNIMIKGHHRQNTIGVVDAI